MKTRLVFASAIIGLLLQSCCDRETRRIQAHWLRAGEGYLVLLDSIDRSDEQIKITGRSVIHAWFDDRGFVGDISAQGYGFWLDMTNKGDKPIKLLWPQARYIDENAKAHEVFRQPMDPLPHPEKMKVSPAVVMQPGERINDVIAPIYKSYMTVFGCREYTPFREPLVPTTLEGRSEAQMKAYVDDLARRQVPVKLVLPIEIDGVRYDYTFAFVLKDRAAPPPKE